MNGYERLGGAFVVLALEIERGYQIPSDKSGRVRCADTT